MNSDFLKSKSFQGYFLIHLILFPVLCFSQVGAKREVRAAWVATVKNIDWPSSSSLPVEDQKKEADIILDSLASLGINTIYLQVRSAADALYSHGMEPWSEWLNGKQGQGPQPPYDPLSYFLEGAHRRGMELHAWINPYRAVFNNQSSNIVPYHIIYQHPDWFFKYGNHTLFNPGLPEVREYIKSVVQDILMRYDVDGIHMDDYFYPYPIKGLRIPDSKTYYKYGSSFGSIQDWRRNNVNTLIKEINQEIKSIKPWVKFGVSPFGIWRNLAEDSLGSETQGGASYDNQFADSRLWIKSGWVDYLIPQIYFSFESKRVPFQKAIAWWNRNNFSRQVYIGLGLYRVGENLDNWTNPNEIPDQILACRDLPNLSGIALYSTSSILRNKLGVKDSLKNKIFSYPAIPPPMKWLDSIAPGPPEGLCMDTLKKGIRIYWKAPANLNREDSGLYYLVYRFQEGEELNTDNSHHLVKILFKKLEYQDESVFPHHEYVYLVSTADRLWNESKTTKPIFYYCPPL